MSWNWDCNGDEDKKEYPSLGTVTISTDEYKDLIQRIADLKVKGQREHDDWYSEKRRADALDEDLREAEAFIAEINEWFDADSEGHFRTAFRLWKVAKEEK